MKLPSVKTLPSIRLESPAAPTDPSPDPFVTEPVTVADIAAGSPALLDAETARVRCEPRVRLTISHLPTSYKRAFQAKARELGLTDKGLLIEMMRRFGLSVVPADQIDGRLGPARGMVAAAPIAAVAVPDRQQSTTTARS